MKKNTIVDTANNGQTTTENTVDNTSKLTKAERREQNYVAFRVNALKRRCKRNYMNLLKFIKIYQWKQFYSLII